MNRMAWLAEIGAIAVCVLFTQTARATDYFVDETHAATADDNPGTDPAAPWRTLTKCASTLVAGDTCHIANTGGTYAGFTETTSGTPGMPITYACEAGSDRATIDSTINLDADHVAIDGCILATVRCNIGATDACHFLSITHNTIRRTGIGIQLHAFDVLISDNTFDELSNDMIRQHGDRWVIRDNVVADEDDSMDVHMDFWQSFCNPSGPGGVGASFSLIENNRFVDVTGGNAHFALTNGNDTCNDAVTNLIFRYNQVRNIGSSGIYIDDNHPADGNTDNAIYNNTFVELSGGMPASWQDYSSNLNASTSSSGFNNIFVDALDTRGATGFLWGAGGTQDCNLYYDSDTTMTFASPASDEAGGVFNEDPLLTNPDGDDFSLREGSAAIDAGCALTRVASTDGGSGASLALETAEHFQPGWAGVDPDCIAVGSADNTACITAIDYGTNIVSLDRALSRAAGDGVWLFRRSDGRVVLAGAGPDIGASERGADTIMPGPDGGVGDDDAGGVSGTDGGVSSATDGGAMPRVDGAPTGGADGGGSDGGGANCSCRVVAARSDAKDEPMVWSISLLLAASTWRTTRRRRARTLRRRRAARSTARA